MPDAQGPPFSQPWFEDSITGCSDQGLLCMLRAGSQGAAEEVHARYAHRLLALAKTRCSANLARCVEPEDIVQSVFRTFFRQVSRGSYHVPEGEELWGLLLVITLNKIRAKAVFHQAARRDVRSSMPLKTESLSVMKGESEAALLRLIIDEQLERLPASRREMIQLRLAGHEVGEIAELTQRSLRTVERVLHAFRGSIRALLDKDD